MRRNAPAAVDGWNASFAAQGRDQNSIQVARADPFCPIDEEIINEFSRLLIENLGLDRADVLPGFKLRLRDVLPAR